MTRYAALLSLSLVACGGDAPPADDLSVQIGTTSARTTEAGHETADVGGAIVTVDVALASVEQIDFSLPDGTTCDDLDPATLAEGVVCDDGDTLQVNGPFVVDLVARVAEPSLEGLAVPPLPYRRVDVRLDPAESDPDLGDGTLVVSGTAGGAPYEIRLEFSEDARFEQEGGIASEDAVAALLLLDVDQWFAGVSLAACAADDGVVDEDADGPCDLENEIKEAIKRSGQLDRDDDGDGLGEDERDIEDALEGEDEVDDTDA